MPFARLRTWGALPTRRDLDPHGRWLYFCSVSAVDVDKLVLEIAARFKEHGMAKHLEHLRGYYRDHRRRLRRHALEKRSPWTEDLVLMWAALWRIPPFENVYPQIPRGRCPCGKSSEANTFIELTFPEGYLMACKACEGRWLVLSGA